MVLEEAKATLSLGDNLSQNEINAAFTKALNKARAQTRMSKEARDEFGAISKRLSLAKAVCLQALMSP